MSIALQTQVAQLVVASHSDLRFACATDVCAQELPAANDRAQKLIELNLYTSGAELSKPNKLLCVFANRRFFDISLLTLCARKPAMCTIERVATVAMDGAVWKVKQDLIIRVDNRDWVKIKASDQGFVRLVCRGIIEKLPKNATLTNSPGMHELIAARNAQATVVVGPSLFADVEPIKKAKRPIGTAKSMRESPTIVDVNLVHDGIAFVLPMVRPAHSSQHICVPLDVDVIERLVMFIRNKGGIVDESLTDKRHYTKPDQAVGVWKAGDGYVAKMQNGGYKRAKTYEEALEFVTKDDEASTPSPIADRGGESAM